MKWVSLETSSAIIKKFGSVREQVYAHKTSNTRGDLKYGLNWNLGYSFDCFSWPLSLFEVVADVGDEEERLGAEPRGGSEVLTGAICGV